MKQVALFIKEEERLINGEIVYDYMIFDAIYKAENHLIREYEKLSNFELVSLTNDKIVVNINQEKIIRMRIETKKVI